MAGRRGALILLAAVVLGICVLGAPAQQPGALPSPEQALPERPRAASPDAQGARPIDSARTERRERRMAAGAVSTPPRDGRGLAEFGKGPFLLERPAAAGTQHPWMAWLPPEERETFVQNLKVWRDLPPEQQEIIRERVKNRIQVETAEALRESGLQLDHDRQEIFELRYSQERRKLERELHQKMLDERAQRLPGIVEQLKKEFADPPAAASAVAPAPPSPSPAAAKPH